MPKSTSEIVTLKLQVEEAEALKMILEPMFTEGTQGKMLAWLASKPADRKAAERAFKKVGWALGGERRQADCTCVLCLEKRASVVTPGPHVCNDCFDARMRGET